MKTSKLFLALAIAVTTLLPTLAQTAMAGSACPPGSLGRMAREYARLNQDQPQTQTEQKSLEVLSNYEIKVRAISDAIAAKDFGRAIAKIDSMIYEGYWPPIDGVNARLAELKSPFTLAMPASTKAKPNPEDHCYRGPHGGGCKRFYTLQIREKGKKTPVREWVSDHFDANDEGSVFQKFSRRDSFPF